ncbi:Arm DNA-binding domain-containing protein [Thalassotalea piscium]|uniref:Integrase DNA-binding domain-containing protein n=1 Tax=Thalassotalea piscium TaxID=1230533 RepID=A0A7X0TTB2_9GAMM|nr:Arm DNA-binding domain-containing protein [Thalassotalea piscium]MBB6542910.1 hypothetical protein [Thalassotalea piscium]
MGYWVIRYTINKKRRDVTAGKYPELSLADVKLEAARIKFDISNGIDPIAEKKRNERSQFNTSTVNG